MLLGGLAVLLGATTFWLAGQARTVLAATPERLTLAPMVGGLDFCLQHRPNTTGEPTLPASCQGATGSAAALVEATLASLGPVHSPDLALGYTLKAPLLDFLRDNAGQWEVDTAAVQRLVQTIRDVPRPVVLYLFSTHFETRSPIESSLASDPSNMAITPQGPLPVDRYYDAKLFPWSVADTTNTISQRRGQVMEAIATELCRQPEDVRARILGVTLLGETHQHFPHFQTGMGFAGPYEVSDYSAGSRQGFRAFLEQRFGQVSRLNAALGSSFPDWGAIDPPAKDIRTQPLQHYWQHMDSFAHGTLPISGWMAPAPAGAVVQDHIKVYLNGEFWERTRVGLGRQDVLEAAPELGTANVGWRLDMDFSRLPTGIHQIDLYLERPGEDLRHLGTRRISVMDQRQATPQLRPQKTLPKAHTPEEGLRYFIDSPADASSYYYNPLAPLWHAYRNQQVVDYLQHFNAIVRKSCLAQYPVFTHQLIPFANPSWDANKYAVDASLQPQPGLLPGISLYGESSYGNSFFEWMQGSRHGTYGVTEFHPLRALPPQELAQALYRHKLRGAKFVSMFIEGRVNGEFVSDERNMFAFDPANTGFGSDVLYASMKQVLANKASLPLVRNNP